MEIATAQEGKRLKINLSQKGILIGLTIFLFFEAGLLFLIIRHYQPSPAKVQTRPAFLRLEPATGTFKVGQEFAVKVMVDTGDFETDATDVRLNFDPTAVVVTQIVPGQIYDDYPAKRVDNATGLAVINGITSLTRTYKGKDTFATLMMKGLKKGKAVLLLEFSPGATNDCNVVATKIAKDVLEQAEGASFEIE